jgi:hypothetical protein
VEEPPGRGARDFAEKGRKYAGVADAITDETEVAQVLEMMLGEYPSYGKYTGVKPSTDGRITAKSSKRPPASGSRSELGWMTSEGDSDGLESRAFRQPTFHRVARRSSGRIFCSLQRREDMSGGRQNKNQTEEDLHMTRVIPGRFAAQIDDPFVVFLIGIRVNRPLAFRK